MFYLGVRICAISLFCFVSLCLRSVLNGLLASLFSLFYVIREFDGSFVELREPIKLLEIIQLQSKESPCYSLLFMNCDLRQG